MLMWDEFIKLLGCKKFDDDFINISSDFNELPTIEESVLGDRSYYSFLQSGVLFLLEDKIIDQITFYATKDEGFSEYEGDLPLSIDSSEHKAVQMLGHPLDSGGGKMDALMGYIDRWIRYEKEGYKLHLQFNQNDRLSRVTLMRSV
ncbi:hypothetical protein IFU37_007970 [Pantoea agglomerans]|uniref:hypothetical protein n=1 Tax=Enterobacter agglomerans TaxID=549 RepID=UPI00177EA444|nr:hypothetical protein [Pantoea agglomerans]WVL91266.1 hypothetical protein IFU37_007970 [Pantoea agglomerans]